LGRIDISDDADEDITRMKFLDVFAEMEL